MRPAIAIESILAGIALLVGGCSQAPSGPAVPYALGVRPLLPVPTDALTEMAPTPTGLQLKLGPQGTNLGDADEALYLLGPEYVEQMNQLDGWSTISPVFMPINADLELDEASFEHLLLIDLERGKLIQGDRRLVGGQTDYGKPVRYLSIQPRAPLLQKSRHALVLYEGVQTTAGEKLSRAPDFQRAWEDGEGAKGAALVPERLRGLEDALRALDLDPDKVLNADVFTTQSIADDLQQLVELVRAHPAPQIDLDADGDGAPDVYTDPKDDPRGVPDFPYEAVDVLVRAKFSIPVYRQPDGPLILQTEPQSREDVEVLITTPVGPGPHPVAVFHHGLGAQKEMILDYAHEFAQLGIATVSIDAPLHAFRTDNPGGAAIRFLSLTNPAITAANFRQAAADQVFLLKVVDGLAQMDLNSDGTPELDASRLVYVGESLGAMVGSLVMSVEPRFSAGVLLVGGGSLISFFQRVLVGLGLDEFPGAMVPAVFQALLDRGDPSNYARLSQERQVLLAQAIDDDVMPSEATIALARAFNLPLVEPVHQPIEGLQVVSPPFMGRALVQIEDADHAAFRRKAPPSVRARSMPKMLDFLRGWVQTGIGEIR